MRPSIHKTFCKIFGFLFTNIYVSILHTCSYETILQTVLQLFGIKFCNNFVYLYSSNPFRYHSGKPSWQTTYRHHPGAALPGQSHDRVLVPGGFGNFQHHLVSLKKWPPPPWPLHRVTSLLSYTWFLSWIMHHSCICRCNNCFSKLVYLYCIAYADFETLIKFKS